ncbi:MAG: hypothetical protein NTU98_15380 [Bacteroidetes bacterium]|nr:hypothetical protein [Bacteroidota bacterium]
MAEITTKVRKFRFVFTVMSHLNKSIISDEIRWLLEAITEQFEAINAYEGKIPQIEFDIIMENIRKLYDNLYRLNRISSPAPHADHLIPEQPVVRPKVPAYTEEVKEPVQEEKPPVHHPVKIRVETTETEHHKKESHKAEKEAGVIDLFAEEASDFQEKLKEVREKSYATERLSSRKGDLKASISINEKFLFINELFDGNLREYNITVETLNGFADIRQALEFLDLERMKNRWESESPAFKRLKELVEQKF